jgi:hypothetical protein
MFTPLFSPRASVIGIALTLSVAAAHAQGFSFTGDFSAGTGTLNVLADTTFNVTASSSGLALVFDEAGAGGLGSGPFVSDYFPNVQYSINGTDYTANFTSNPRWGSTRPDLSANDAYVFTLSTTLSPGDVVVFKQGSYTAGAQSSSNFAALEGVTVQQAFLMNSAGVRISDVVVTAVPEPEEYAAVAAAGLIGFGLWRRAQRRG